MDPITLALLLGGGSGLFNLISGDMDRKTLEEEQKKKLEAYKSQLGDMKYDAVEKGQALKGVEKVNNSTLAQTMNQAALGTANSMNATQMKGALIAPIVSQNMQRMLNTTERIDSFNKDIDSKIASADLNAPSVPSVDIGGILENAINTGLAGYQMAEGLNMQDKMMENEKQRQKDMFNFFKGTDTTSFESWKKNLGNSIMNTIPFMFP